MLAYQFRLYPNKEEERKLFWTKEICRLTYNRFLELYNGGEHDHGMLQAMLPVWKETEKDLEKVHSKVLQYELYQLFSNIAALRQMKKNGRKVGNLRFKGERWFKTFTYNQSGFKLLPKNDKFGFLHLSKIGNIPIRLHRQVVGTIKCVTIKHMPSGKWYAHMSVDDGKGEPKLTVIENAIGLDFGLEHYTVDSNGDEVENPRFLKKDLKKLRREQRRLSKCQKGSRNRNLQMIKVARQHEHVQNQRNDFQHKLARKYVDEHDLIVTEKLSPLMMVRNRCLARSISDAAWSSLNQKIAYKAENAGKLFVQVDARNTSQICSQCGTLVPKTLKNRVHDCPQCNAVLGRDHNAALVILDRGLRKVRSERPELTLVNRKPLPGSASPGHAIWLKQEASARKGEAAHHF
jgi:putative transposase